MQKERNTYTYYIFFSQYTAINDTPLRLCGMIVLKLIAHSARAKTKNTHSKCQSSLLPYIRSLLIKNALQQRRIKRKAAKERARFRTINSNQRLCSQEKFELRERESSAFFVGAENEFCLLELLF